MEYKTIKQGAGDHMCVVCVLAMATGTTPEDVYAFLNDGRVIGDPAGPADEALYLLSHGLVKGGGYHTHGKGGKGNADLNIQFIYPAFPPHPAIVEVMSQKYEGEQHSLFWDGKYLRDPNPDTPYLVKIEDYQVMSIWPLTYIQDKGRLRNFKFPPGPTPLFVRESRNERKWSSPQITMSEDELLEALRDYVEMAGTHEKAAEMLGVSRSAITLALQGVKGIGPKMARALGYEPAFVKLSEAV